MKKIFFLLVPGLLFSVSVFGQRNNDALDGSANDKEAYRNATMDFYHGKARTGEEYFFGILAAVVWIEVKWNGMEHLDSIDAKPEVFETHYDVMISMIEDCRMGMKQYEGRGWAKQKELQDLTVEWLNAMKVLVNDHLRPLAQAMSIKDKKWTDADHAAYDNYLEALEIYYEVDNRWVDFQYVYAKANRFELSDQTIDLTPLMEEDIRD